MRGKQVVKSIVFAARLVDAQETDSFNPQVINDRQMPEVNDSALRLKHQSFTDTLRSSTKTRPEKMVDAVVTLPDLDKRPEFLDLASGKMIAFQDEKEVLAFKQGDLGFDRKLWIIRGGVASLWDGKTIEKLEASHKADANANGYEIPGPCRLLVTTGDGNRFDVQVTEKVADGGLKIEYRPAKKVIADPPGRYYLRGRVTGIDSRDGGFIDISLGRKIDDDGSVTLTALEQPLSKINVSGKTLDELVPIIQDRYQKGYHLREKPKVMLWLNPVSKGNQDKTNHTLPIGENPKSIDFHGLKLERSDGTSKPSELPLLWKEVPAGSKSFEMRDNVQLVYQGLDGSVFYRPDKIIFYVQCDLAGSSRLTYYGPYTGNPMLVLNLPGKGVTPAGKTLPSRKITGINRAVEHTYPIQGNHHQAGTIRGKVVGDFGPYQVTIKHKLHRDANLLPNLSVKSGESFEFTNVPIGQCTITAKPSLVINRGKFERAIISKQVTVKDKQTTEVMLSNALPANEDHTAVTESTNLTRQLEALQTTLQQLRTRLGERHPRILQMKQQIELLQRRLIALKSANANDATDTQWGEAVDGVQIRIHTPDVRRDQNKWMILLKTDLRASKPRILPHYGLPIDEYVIQWNDKWYRQVDRIASSWASVAPSKAQQRDSLHTRVTAKGWVEESTGKPMPIFSPGKYTLRIGFPLIDSPEVEGRKPLRAISNPLEIEIATVTAVTLPDVDRRDINTVLDLASGTFIENVARDGNVDRFNELGKGDLWQDGPNAIGTLRGGKIEFPEAQRLLRQEQGASAYELPDLPCQFTVITAEGKQFEVKVIKKTEAGSLEIEYRPAGKAGNLKN